MNPLPPLRTVRASSHQSWGLTCSPPPPPPIPSLDNPSLLPPARAFLGEAVEAGLLDPEAVPAFVAKAGDRLGQLTSRERTGDVLCGLGFLTRYQLSRVLAGQTFGLVFGGYRVLDRLSSG